MGRSKEDVARELVQAHFDVEPGLTRVFLIRADDWDDPTKPIRLLEVNENTMTTGAVEAYSFSPTVSTPFPTTIAEITPEEYTLIEQHKLPLPRGWSLDKAESFERTKAA